MSVFFRPYLLFPGDIIMSAWARNNFERNMIMNRKITIIGAGMMGSALAFPAAENGHEVHICD